MTSIDIANPGASEGDLTSALIALLPGTLIDSGWVDVSSADILALDTTEKTILAAQGANKIIAPIEVHIKFSAGNVPYTGGSQLKIVYEGDTYSHHHVSFGTILIETTAQFGWGLTAQEVLGYFANADCANKALVLKTHPSGGPYIDGNGTAKVRVFYRLVDIP